MLSVSHKKAASVFTELWTMFCDALGPSRNGPWLGIAALALLPRSRPRGHNAQPLTPTNHLAFNNTDQRYTPFINKNIHNLPQTLTINYIINLIYLFAVK